MISQKITVQNYQDKYLWMSYMILIAESKPKKLSGLSSLFVNFDYNAKISRSY